jgi:hypothetical protein
MTVVLAGRLRLLLITNVGLMATRLQEITPLKVACIPRSDTSVKQPRTITWEGLKLTRNYWYWRHLNIIA